MRLENSLIGKDFQDEGIIHRCLLFLLQLHFQFEDNDSLNPSSTDKSSTVG